jgi:hypothetical protein|tara:strand:- start:172 stop:570 length:399 start_codon:yes stop_codon:yes gene_type:complete
MTADKSLKQLIRACMKKTGESYTTARLFFRKPVRKDMTKQTKKILLVGENLVLRHFTENDIDLFETGFNNQTISEDPHDWFAQNKQRLSPEKFFRSQLSCPGDIVETQGSRFRFLTGPKMNGWRTLLSIKHE